MLLFKNKMCFLVGGIRSKVCLGGIKTHDPHVSKLMISRPNCLFLHPDSSPLKSNIILGNKCSNRGSLDVIIFRPHKWGRKIMICVAFFPNSAITPLFTSLFSTLSLSYLTIFLNFWTILQNSQVTKTA